MYLYLDDLSAAVLIDGASAYTDAGDPLTYDSQLAQHIRVMEYDDALELLRVG